MVVAHARGRTTSGCGAATFAPRRGAPSITFANGTIAANGSCTVSVSGQCAGGADDGAYPNTSEPPLRRRDRYDKSASATLGRTMDRRRRLARPHSSLSGRWRALPGTTSAGLFHQVQTRLPERRRKLAPGSPQSTIDTATGNPAQLLVQASGMPFGHVDERSNNDYIEFAVNTTNYNSAHVRVRARRDAGSNGPSIAGALFAAQTEHNFTSYGSVDHARAMAFRRFSQPFPGPLRIVERTDLFPHLRGRAATTASTRCCTRQHHDWRLPTAPAAHDHQDVCPIRSRWAGRRH